MMISRLMNHTTARQFIFVSRLFTGWPVWNQNFSMKDIFTWRDLILMKVAVNLGAHFVQFGFSTVATRYRTSLIIFERDATLTGGPSRCCSWLSKRSSLLERLQLQVHSGLQPRLLEIMPLCHFISRFLYFFLYPFSNIAHCI